MKIRALSKIIISTESEKEEQEWLRFLSVQLPTLLLKIHSVGLVFPRSYHSVASNFDSDSHYDSVVPENQLSVVGVF